MAKSNSNFSALFDVELDTSNIQKQLDAAAKNIKAKIGVEVDTKGISGVSKEMDKATQAINQTSTAMDNAELSFNAANEIFSTTIDIITAMVDQVYELDAAITEFTKVSDLSGESLTKYIGQLNEMGDSVARTGSEMLEAATEFRKNGFNDQDAATLGQVASQFQNIADEAISAGDSASFIISQLIAFNMEAEESTHIIDAVNEVKLFDLYKQGELLGT